MEIKQLRYFLAVYKCGNITQTAEELYITQQTLSKQLKNFEEELGVPLFTRSVHGAEPTKYAEKLLDSAREIVRIADNALCRLDEMRREQKITIRLGLLHGDFNAHSALDPKILYEWERAFPQMTLEIREFIPGEDLEHRLLQGELDLVYIGGEESSELQKVPISTEPAYALVSQDNFLARADHVTLEELASQPVLIPRAWAANERIKHRLEMHLGSTPHFLEFNGVFAQGAEHVRANEGILFAPRSYCLSRNLDGLVTFPFPDPAYTFHRYLAYRKDWHLPIPVKAFIKEHQQAIL